MKVAVIFALSVCAALAHSPSLKAAEKCNSQECTIENNCRCSSQTSPLTEGNAPQLIALTFDESIGNETFNNIWQPLLFDRKNPDGNPISATFFVPHEYTDYKRVRDLYARGFEIGVNSITKNSLTEYWKNATESTLAQEFGGQRTIISHFANIPSEDIVGARTPQLQIDGDLTIDAYVESNIQYDNSWTSRSSTRLFPYTLDYLSSQECRTGTTCPTESHPGFWIVPIINLQGQGGIECNVLTTCFMSGTSDEIAAWLTQQVERHSGSNKAPLTLMLSSGYFIATANALEGFTKFLDGLGSDVFLVNVKQIMDWIKNPVPLDQFTTDAPQREVECDTPRNCALTNTAGETRYMVSCVPCPEVYPWLGNPLGLRDPDATTTTTETTTIETTTIETTTATLETEAYY